MLEPVDFDEVVVVRVLEPVDFDEVVVVRVLLVHELVELDEVLEVLLVLLVLLLELLELVDFVLLLVEDVVLLLDVVILLELEDEVLEVRLLLEEDVLLEVDGRDDELLVDEDLWELVLEILLDEVNGKYGPDCDEELCQDEYEAVE